MPGGLQGAAQFAEVVDFAVADDGDVVRFIKNGLSAAGNVNDAQAAHAERRAGCTCRGDEQLLITGPRQNGPKQWQEREDPHGGNQKSVGRAFEEQAPIDGLLPVWISEVEHLANYPAG